jgi:aryl-alcohol dehydrogenase-like predicted oxidoreductase
MERRELGQAGLLVPALGLGTRGAFDVVGKEAQQARRRLIDEALDLGANFFDTSAQDGEAERILGAALTGRRGQAFVATKLWADQERDGQRQIDRALHFFDGWVDLYQVQDLKNWELFAPVLRRMKTERSLRAIGVSHARPIAFPAIIRLMQAGRVDVVQIPLHPLMRAAEAELLPLAGRLGVGVVVMRPFAGGRLLLSTPPEASLRRFQPFGVRTWPQVLLKWILSDQRVSTVLVGTRRPAHLQDNLLAANPPWFGQRERDAVVDLARLYANQP